MIVKGYTDNVLTYFPQKGRPLKDIFFGVELEIGVDNLQGAVGNIENEWSGPAKRLLENLEELLEDFAIIKHDGSLYNGGHTGIELVTIPTSLSLHKKQWKKIFSSPTWNPETLSPNPTCGMHVHVSKAPLPSVVRWGIHHFICRAENKKFITAIAGRGPVHYCTPIIKPIETLEQRTPYGRYEAVNHLNSKTIEVRIFASTNSLQLLLARLEFIAGLVHWLLEVKEITESILLPEYLTEFTFHHCGRYGNFNSWMETYAKS